MGIFGDNYWAKVYGGNNTVSIAQDSSDKFDEEKHPRNKKGEGGGQFRAKPETIEKQDDLSDDDMVTLPGGKKVNKGYSILYRGEHGELRDTKYSPFLKSQGKSGELSPEMDSILDRLFGGEHVGDSEILEIPEWKEAIEREKKAEALLESIYGVKRTIDIETAERNVLRDKIIDAAMSDHITQTVPIDEIKGVRLETNEGLGEGEEYDVEKGKKAFIVIGFPAAGKSTTYANPLAKKHKARLCDSDTIKKVLPEFDNGYGGNLVHEESKLINEEVLRRSMERGDNIVYPILGHKADAVEKLINAFHDKGYSVCLCFKDTHENIAKGRLLVRFIQKGRYLPLSCISKAARGVRSSFDSNKKKVSAHIRSTNARGYGKDTVEEQDGELAQGII